MTLERQLAKSIPPPIPFIIFPGIIQFAKSPALDTSIAPRMVISICPPLTMANDSSLPKKEAPGRTVTVSLPFH